MSNLSRFMITVVLGLTSLCSSAQAANLLTNGDFENGLTGWTAWGHHGNGGSATTQSDGLGGHLLYANISGYGTRGIYQKVAVTSVDLIFEAAIRDISLTYYSTSYIRLYLLDHNMDTVQSLTWFINSTSNWTESESTIEADFFPSVPGRSDWRQISMDVGQYIRNTFPTLDFDSVGYVHIELNAYSGVWGSSSQAYIDDVVLLQNNQASAVPGPMAALAGLMFGAWGLSRSRQAYGSRRS